MPDNNIVRAKRKIHMRAFIKRSIEEGFVLEEEHIVKIADICRRRISEKEITSAIIYKVYRADALVYETEDHSIITKEENGKRNRIKRLWVGCKAENLDFSLDFDRIDGIGLRIEADERDFAYLLYSDIKDYLTTEVAKYRKFSFKNIFNSGNALLFIMIPLLLWIFYTISHGKLDASAIQQLMDATDIHNKLNYLIEVERRRSGLGEAWVMTFPAIGVAAIAMLIGPLLDRYFPINVFCWGKEEDEYKKKLLVREKVIWGVIISFAMSAMASLAIYFLTK